MSRLLQKAGTLLLLSSMFVGIRTHAQENQLEVLVEQIAVASIYLRAGTDEGITVDDTLTVLDSSGDRTVGALDIPR